MNKKGFTLIELLGVIIILGILMIIAIPSVSRHVSDSRKSTYVETVNEMISGVKNYVNEGMFGMYESDTTYYIPASTIDTENEFKSPYGDFTEAYIGVTFDGQKYQYYWVSVDDAGQGVSNIVPFDELNEDDIESDLTDATITNIIENTTIGNSTKIAIYDPETNEWRYVKDNGPVVPEYIVCIPAPVLHTTTCQRTDDYGCNHTGILGYGKTITYGSLVDGTPKPGNAYDCKVTAAGGYTERFYYVGSSGENSVLIYYKNYSNVTTAAYDSSGANNRGPISIFQYLPSTSEWDNPGIIAPGVRQIYTELGTTSTQGGALGSFNYTNKAARFLTFQEIAAACGTDRIIDQGYLKHCEWLAENLQYDKPGGAFGFWLENPYSVDDYRGWVSTGYFSRIGYAGTINNQHWGIRPAITVKTISLGTY